MSIDIVFGTTNKPIASNELARIIRSINDADGLLYIGYPVVATVDGPYLIDALLITQQHGIVIFDLIDSADDVEGFHVRQDETANKVLSRLFANQELMEQRTLAIPVNTISFYPVDDRSDIVAAEDYTFAKPSNLTEIISTFNWYESDIGIFRRTLSTFQNITTIRQTSIQRHPKRSDSLGARLIELEKSIATLDRMQSRAVIETIDGIQRIRGLAGSGKTIVLALKTAYLHSLHPEWKIAVTFHTRSLKRFYHELVTKFVVEQTGNFPDWDNIHVLNSWGAPGSQDRAGMYYMFCRVNDTEYYDFRAASRRFGRERAFAAICEKAVSEVDRSRTYYDAILIDEAQDLPVPFLRMCFELLKQPKRLVYAYDELQNLSNTSLPSPENIFGVDLDNQDIGYVPDEMDTTSRWDIILRNCYRHSRPILTTAHALGFGVYRRRPVHEMTGLVQMFDDARLWSEVGYVVKTGELTEGSTVVLARSQAASPAFLEKHSANDDIISFETFADAETQAEWLAQSIKENLQRDDLNPSDILVINPDPRTTVTNVGPTRELLQKMGINSHVAGVDTSPDVFYLGERQSITFTGIHRAKGNEAAMVYVINAHECHAAFHNLGTIRNRLFTAITRSKAWIRILGYGSGMVALTGEFERLKAKNFELQFQYPTSEQLKRLRVVHRDISERQLELIHSRQQDVATLLHDLESGDVTPDDLDPDTLRRLRDILG